MIKYCCYYCGKFANDTCEQPKCYNAYAHPQDVEEGKWYCQPYEGGECGETITNNGPMAEEHKDCWTSTSF